MTDSFDAPVDDDFVRTPSPDATAIAIALNNVARAIDRLAQVSPGGAQVSAPSQPSGTPNGAPGAPPGGQSDDTRIKMSKKVFAICKQNNWDIQDVAQRATGRAHGADSRKWSQADLGIVLDVMKTQWGTG